MARLTAEERSRKAQSCRANRHEYSHLPAKESQGYCEAYSQASFNKSRNAVRVTFDNRTIIIG